VLFHHNLTLVGAGLLLSQKSNAERIFERACRIEMLVETPPSTSERDHAIVASLQRQSPDELPVIREIGWEYASSAAASRKFGFRQVVIFRARLLCGWLSGRGPRPGPLPHRRRSAEPKRQSPRIRGRASDGAPHAIETCQTGRMSGAAPMVFTSFVRPPALGFPQTPDTIYSWLAAKSLGLNKRLCH
jgi:hypothetical protein